MKFDYDMIITNCVTLKEYKIELCSLMDVNQINDLIGCYDREMVEDHCDFRISFVPHRN